MMYNNEMSKVRQRLATGDAVGVASELEKKADTPGDNQLLYMLEYGTALQAAGDYKKSNQYFLKADDLSEVKDYFSISRQVGSVLLNQGMLQYPGEDYEKVFINAMVAINFLGMNDFENAMTQVRRLNEKLYKYRFEAKRNYEQNPFAFYLAGLLREEEKDWDNAYIEYNNAYKNNPNIEYLKKDLVRISQKARREEDLKKWQKTFGIKEDKWDKDDGEIVLILQQGWVAFKRPNPNFVRVPKLYHVDSMTTAARMEVVGPKNKKYTEDTKMITSLYEVADKTLDEQYAGLVAKRIGGIVAKEVVADQIRQKNEALGAIAQIAMHVSDQADLRFWATLPETLQIARLRVPKGTYDVNVQGLMSMDATTEEKKTFEKVKVKPGKRTFLVWRAFL